MGQRIVRRLVLLLALSLAQIVAVQPALGQGTPVPAPPVRSMVDANGVDLTSGELITGSLDVAIGPANHHGLSFSRQWFDNGWRFANMPTISGNTSYPVVSFQGGSVAFKPVSGGYEPYLQNGAALNASRTLFTGPDGTQITFEPSAANFSQMDTAQGRPVTVTFPDGVVWTYYYTDTSFQIPIPECDVPSPPPACQYMTPPTVSFSRLASITSSTGYQIKLVYASNVGSLATITDFLRVTQAIAINNAVEYCSPTATCSLSGTWPTAAYGGTLPQTPATFTDPAGGMTTYTYTSGQLTGIKPPGAASDAVTYTYSGGKVATAVVAGAGTWTYTYGSGTASVLDPLSHTRSLSYNADAGVTLDTNELSQPTAIAFCAADTSTCRAGLPQTVTDPELNTVTYTYDARANVTSQTFAGKPGSGVASIVTSAAYPSTCTNPKTCNQPTSTTDERGQVTDYTYDSGHGGVLTVTAPADAGGVRPQTRITYSSVNARYLTAASTFSNGAAIAVPSGVSSCRMASSGNPASCVGTAEERVTTVAYLSGVPSNAQPNSVTAKAGNNTLVTTTSVAYDDNGWPATVDGPQSGTADRTLLAYRDDGRLVWTIGPDPDGAGAAKYPATIYNYNPDGQIDYVQSGTVDNQSGGFATWTELGRTAVRYDGFRRPVREAAYGFSTVLYQVTDTVYDSVGRPLCSVQRMSSSSWGTQATSCTPPATTTPVEQDRVTWNRYDSLGRVDQVITGYGTSAQATELTRTFTPNGQVQTVTDAEGNLTTYAWDGHDRLYRTYFPSKTTDGVSSTTDYEQLTYDISPADNKIYFRTRAGETLTYYFDNLGRTRVKVVPERSGLSSTHTRDVWFDYDLFGDMTLAGFDSASPSDGIVNTFNALGQLTASETVMDGVSRTLIYAYDVAGNRTALFYPDHSATNPRYVSYVRYGSGALYYLAQGGIGPLVYPQYDSAGRTSVLSRLNTSTGNWGNNTDFIYDAFSRLLSHSFSFTSSSYNSSTTFTYNSAQQIASSTRSNDAYAFPGYASVNRAYTANGLNEYSAVAGTGFAYDANANLTSDAANTFVYDVENRLVTRSGGASATLRYDPLGRLYEATGSSGTRRFLYDGDALVAEYSTGGTLLRRYVHGPGAGDNPLVWFEGPGVSNAERRYLYADERGSIVAVTDGAGTVTNVNSYDEHGIPAATNVGAFQYTGQVWLPELGMYTYKARMYSPTLGRFMQTDPIGYGDGMNMYGYVGNDPVNGVDPTGLDGENIYVTGPPPQFPQCSGNASMPYAACVNGQWFSGFGACNILNFFVPGSGCGGAGYGIPQYGSVDGGDGGVAQSSSSVGATPSMPSAAQQIRNCRSGRAFAAGSIPQFHIQNEAMFMGITGPTSGTEYGYISDLKTGLVGPLFTSNLSNGINQGDWLDPFGNAWNSSTPGQGDWVFNHLHPNVLNPELSGPGTSKRDTDWEVAIGTGMLMMATDRNGNHYCSGS